MNIRGQTILSSFLSLHSVLGHPRKAICCRQYSDRPSYHTFITEAAHHSEQEIMLCMIKPVHYSLFHYCAPFSTPDFHFPLLLFILTLHFTGFLSFSLSFSVLIPASTYCISIFLCQYADRVWGLGKERDIKSGLWLCTRLLPRL